MTQQDLAQIGVTGLSVMGRNLARNFVSRGYVVAIHNRTQARTDALIAEHGAEGAFLPAGDLPRFVASLQQPRKIVIMVKAGRPTDDVIDELIPLLDTDDVIIDAGNSHFADTRRREQLLRSHGLRFVGTGVSGGEEGALLGPSIMPGGDPDAYAQIGPFLESIAARVDGQPCCTHVGPDGAGHFVKMVHNGIEYADMQLIAEAYDLLRVGLTASAADIAEIFVDWNTGDLESFLIEITADVLAHIDAATGKAFVDIVADQAEQKGTGRWAVQSALDLGVPITGIAEATFARAISGAVTQRSAARQILPGHAGSLDVGDRGAFIEDVRLALYASKVVAYAQGFEQIAAASGEYGWNIDRGAMASLWRGGCIIRARFLGRIVEAFQAKPDLPSLLVDPYFAAEVGRGVASWRRIVAAAAASGIPVPAFGSSLAYYDALRSERLPTALIQAQRDFFGAHTYRRVDREGSFHTNWAGDRAEVMS
jgi:6-phosphogluconate dehydrogenase